MVELKAGDLIVCNALIGFVIEVNELAVKVNTEVGERSIAKTGNIAVLSTAQELASVYANNIMKGVLTHGS